MVRGRTEVNGIWTYELIPKRVGELTIPSFEINGETSQEITIVVKALDAEKLQAIEQEAFFITKIDRERQYVHGAIHVEQRFYYSDKVIQVAQSFPPPSNIANAYVIPVGEIERTFAFRNNKQYSVLVQKFVVFPETSGELWIPTIDIVTRMQFESEYRNIPISSSPQRIAVLPIPDQFPTNQPWLPATSVHAKDSLVDDDLSQLRVGDTVTRKITLTVVDAYSTGIPQYEFPIPNGIRQYTELPKLTEEILVGEIIASREETTALLLTEPGRLVLPEVEISWWNTNTDQLEKTFMPSVALEVAARSGTPNAPQVDPSIAQTEVPNPSSVGTPAVINSSPFGWFWQITLGLGWLVALLLVGLILWNNRDLWARVQQRLPSIMQLQDLNNDDPKIVKECMIKWIETHRGFSRLEAIEALESHRETQVVLGQLNAKLYGEQHVELTIDQQQLRTVLNELVKNDSVTDQYPNSFVRLYSRLKHGRA